MDNKPTIMDVAGLLPEARLINEIGSGAYKVVFCGEVQGHLEAVKFVRIPSGTDEEKNENTARIKREINILDICKSQCLVRLGAISPKQINCSGYDYVVYSEELLIGKSLREHIQMGVFPDINKLTDLALSLFRTIKDLSSLGYIHRDIKPENIFCTDDIDRPYILLDLGIAFHIGGTSLTGDSNRILGTLYYIAPEMLDMGFRQSLDHRSDLYTAGLTLYEYAICRNPYWVREPAYSTLERIKKITPSPLYVLRPDLPRVFCNIVDQLIKKRPALRPGNLVNLIQQMEQMR